MNNSLQKGAATGVIVLVLALVVVAGIGFFAFMRGAEAPAGELGEEAIAPSIDGGHGEGEESMAGEGKEDAVLDPPSDSGQGEGGAMMGDSENVVLVELTGKNFAYSKNEIRVKEGDTVKVRFTSTDGFHDFVVDEFNAKTGRVNTGGTTEVTFVVDKKGSFEYYCSVGSHRQMGMVGTFIVE